MSSEDAYKMFVRLVDTKENATQGNLPLKFRIERVDWAEVGKVYGIGMQIRRKIDFWEMIRRSAIKHKPTRWMRFKRFFTRR